MSGKSLGMAMLYVFSTVNINFKWKGKVVYPSCVLHFSLSSMCPLLKDQSPWNWCCTESNSQAQGKRKVLAKKKRKIHHPPPTFKEAAPGQSAWTADSPAGECPAQLFLGARTVEILVSMTILTKQYIVHDIVTRTIEKVQKYFDFYAFISWKSLVLNNTQYLAIVQIKIHTQGLAL